jgi:hypothetical protein
MELQGFFELHCFAAITLPHQLQLFCICYTFCCNYTYPQNYRVSSNYTVLLQLHYHTNYNFFVFVTLLVVITPTHRITPNRGIAGFLRITLFCYNYTIVVILLFSLQLQVPRAITVRGPHYAFFVASIFSIGVPIFIIHTTSSPAYSHCPPPPLPIHTTPPPCLSWLDPTEPPTSSTLLFHSPPPPSQYLRYSWCHYMCGHSPST